MSAAAAAPETKKAAKPKIPTAHPPYASMVNAVIKSLKERTGSSRQSILKYVVANYEVESRVTKALKKMIAGKSVVSAAAAGKKGAGCFKLPAKWCQEGQDG